MAYSNYVTCRFLHNDNECSCAVEKKVVLLQNVQFGSYIRWTITDPPFRPKYHKTNYRIRTPHYYGQFALSLGKESPYIYS